MITKPTIYTAEFVLGELVDMINETLAHPEYYLMGELFETRQYHQFRFSEWKKKFRDNPEISQAIRKLKGIFEFRINKGGLNGTLNSKMTVFNLKNNYAWVDKKEFDQNVNLPAQIGIAFIKSNHSEDTDE